MLAKVLARGQDGHGWDKGTEGRREGLGGGFFFFGWGEIGMTVMMEEGRGRKGKKREGKRYLAFAWDSVCEMERTEREGRPWV